MAIGQIQQYKTTISVQYAMNHAYHVLAQHNYNAQYVKMLLLWVLQQNITKSNKEHSVYLNVSKDNLFHQ